MEATHFTNMATGHNRFSVVKELSFSAFRKFAAQVSPRRGYPELPDLSDNPLPTYLFQRYTEINSNLLAYSHI
jgi:hypothetical protein